MSRVIRVRPVVQMRHLDSMLSAYADRTLAPDVLLDRDRHVAICPRCRAAVDDERRMLISLRTAVTPGVPSRLESALLDLGVHAGPLPSAGAPRPLAVIRRSAPPMHRSPMRAAMLASLAAGASAAAAWSLSLSGPAPVGGSLTVVRLPSPAATARSTIGSASSGREASFLGPNRFADVAASAGITTMFKAGSVVPDAAPQATPLHPLPRLVERGLRSAQSIHE